MAAGTWLHQDTHLLKRDVRHTVHEVSKQEPENNLTIEEKGEDQLEEEADH